MNRLWCEPKESLTWFAFYEGRFYSNFALGRRVDYTCQAKQGMIISKANIIFETKQNKIVQINSLFK